MDNRLNVGLMRLCLPTKEVQSKYCDADASRRDVYHFHLPHTFRSAVAGKGWIRLFFSRFFSSAAINSWTAVVLVAKTRMYRFTPARLMVIIPKLFLLPLLNEVNATALYWGGGSTTIAARNELNQSRLNAHICRLKVSKFAATLMPTMQKERHHRSSSSSPSVKWPSLCQWWVAMSETMCQKW